MPTARPAILLRRSSLAALAVLLWLGSACRGRESPAPPTPQVTQVGSSHLPVEPAHPTAPADLPALLPLFDEKPDHPWNRVHRALFANPRRIQRAACLDNRPPSCDQVGPLGYTAQFRPAAAEYAETSTLLVPHDIAFLLEGARLSEALSALAAAGPVAPESQPLAAALLQHDLWERFDALERALSDSKSPALAPRRPALLRLRDAVGRLMYKLALPAATVRKFPGNRDALAHAYPDLLAGLTTAGWVEVVARATDRPPPFTETARDGTRHAMIAEFRSAFRRLVWIPEQAGGAEWLKQALSPQPGSLSLPAGTRAVLFEIPFVLSREGEIVALPLVTLLEARTVPSAGSEAISLGLANLGFEVFEGRRAWLRAKLPQHGGLERLAVDAAFPSGGSCSPQPDMLVPMRSACALCHGVRGDRLSGTMSHGTQALHITDDDGAHLIDLAREEKRTRPEFAALQRYFSEVPPNYGKP